ncbi:hypothetical protein KW807_01360 [Candidatus Parcubacteria bacterium]|nr:hypothetical protein [Candidatus Parcubacteria bacterium]
MNNEEDLEINLEPVEIHPEMYSSNLFGEAQPTGKHSVSEELLTPSVGEVGAPFNIWAFTDAIGARKKRDAWVLYHKALASGMAAEEVFYKFVWQVKTMLIASKTHSAEEAEMKSYPYSKAKGFLKNFKATELEKLSEALVIGYHKARRGHGEVETLVEKMLLKL